MVKNCDEEITITCPFCNKTSSQLNCFNKLFNTPKILIINFKNNDGKKLLNIDEEIDLSDNKITTIGPTTYHLFALIAIDKEKSNKHYIAYIKSQNQWNCIDSGKVTNCSYDDICKRGIPSLIFYVGN